MLTEQGQYSADWGLLFELEKDRILNNWELTTGLLFEKEFGIELPNSFRTFITTYARGIHHKTYVLGHVLDKVSFKSYNKKSIKNNPSTPFPYTQRIFLGTTAEDFQFGFPKATTYVPSSYEGKVYKGHSSDVVTDITLNWLKNKRDKNKPFFLMHQFKAPHDYFEYAPRYNDYLENVIIPEPVDLYGVPDTFGSVATRGENDALIRVCRQSGN